MGTLQRTLYHGSKNRIEKPTYGLGKPYNDYGLGFYCTEHLDMAKEWAVGFDHDGFANTYTLDMTGLTVVDLSGEGFTAMNWLATLLRNRWFNLRAPLPLRARDYILDTFSVDLSHADVVEGYRADDSYFMFAQDFLSGTITYQQLKRAMRLGDLGKQVMLKSKRAFKQLAYVEALPALRSEWLARRMTRDRKAREAYLAEGRNALDEDGLYISAILTERMGVTDARLQ